MPPASAARKSCCLQAVRLLWARVPLTLQPPPALLPALTDLGFGVLQPLPLVLWWHPP